MIHAVHIFYMGMKRDYKVAGATKSVVISFAFKKVSSRDQGRKSAWL